MPMEHSLQLQPRGTKLIACKLQRGKANCVERPDSGQQPLAPQVNLVDVSLLPMVPATAVSTHPGHAARG